MDKNSVEVNVDADLKELLQRAYLVEQDSESDLSATEEDELRDFFPFASPHAPTTVPFAHGSQSVSNTSPRQNSTSTLPKRTAQEVDGQHADARPLPRQNRRNRNRAKRRRMEIASEGHPQGSGVGFRKNVLPSQAVETSLGMKEFPVASGGFVGVDAEFRGAKVPRTLEKLLADGMQLIKFEPGKSVPVTDRDRRVSAVMIYGPQDPSYLEAVKDMAESIIETGKATKWDKTEKNHKRAGSPAAARGISFGQGQPKPMRLSDKRQEATARLMETESFRRVAGFQSSAFATWFPCNYSALRLQNNELQEKLPNLEFNFDNSVYSCATVNFGPSMWSYIHTDSKNDPTVPCTITAGGNYNHIYGGHIILWDFNLIFEFPPGATIILPSALVRHSNIPVQKGETRISITQYTAGGIRRWLEYGGRTEEEFEREDPKGFQDAWSERTTRWGEDLKKFLTIEKLKGWMAQ